MSFKPIDPRRDEYRKYLERTGVVELLSKVILELYQTPDPKPENAVEFVRKKLGDTMLESDTIEHLKRELEDSQNEVANLERQIEALKLEMAKKITLLSSEPAEDSTVETEEVKSKDEHIENDEQVTNEEKPTPEVESSTEVKPPEVKPTEVKPTEVKPTEIKSTEVESENETEENGDDDFKEAVNEEVIEDVVEAVVEQNGETTENKTQTNEEMSEKKDNSEVAVDESTAPA